ncbi:MAG: hypothetical protein PHD51_01800 [Patescibacteria group bacterium]|nr:hypothetical protein [Patescibacteria group bacterium]MDD5490403.1 hypothetical protein [Patescibacteria group bacterium]
MFDNLGIFALIAVLFYLLGRSADLVVINLRRVGKGLNVSLFFLGIFLGVFTTLPEFVLGINALISGVGEISFGNLVGGIVVLLGLILGGSAILNRKIAASGELSSFLSALAILFIPLLLGLDGKVDWADGVFMILAYSAAVFYLYLRNKKKEPTFPSVEITNTRKIIKNIFGVIIGVALVAIIANLIMRYTFIVLERLDLPAFFVGLLVFSLGTNLPEIIVSLRAWRRHVEELSLSNILGSAIANVLIIGILSVFKNIGVSVNSSYYLLFIIFGVLFLLLAIFYRTGRQLTNREGAVLVLIYAVFVIAQSFILAR